MQWAVREHPELLLGRSAEDSHFAVMARDPATVARQVAEEDVTVVQHLPYDATSRTLPTDFLQVKSRWRNFFRSHGPSSS
jgi:hypothetical protein